MQHVKNFVIAKAIIKIIGILMVIMVAYLIIDFGNASSIIDKYESLKPNSNSGFSKSLQFLETYTKSTGDVTLALSKGMSEEEANEIASGGTLQNGGAPLFDTQFKSADLRSQIEMLTTDTGYNNTYYESKLKLYTVGNTTFAWESQSNGAWSSFKPSSATMAGKGCFYYACSALVGAKLGKVYTIEQCLTDLGGIVTTDSGGTFVVNPTPISDLNGSINQLNKILQKSGIGASATSVSGIDSSKLSNGEAMYIIYATKDVGSSKELYSPGGEGAHWTAVVGVENGSYIVLGNGDRSVLQPPGEFNDLKYIFEVK